MDRIRQSRRIDTLRAEARQAADACVADAVRAAARDATQVVDGALAPTGLTGTQFSLMCRIASADDDRLGSLAQRSGLDASTLSRALDALARRGWVEVATVGTDRRRRFAWLTESGLRTLADAMPHWQRAQDVLRAGLDARTLPSLRRARAAWAEHAPADGAAAPAPRARRAPADRPRSPAPRRARVTRPREETPA